jgi:hypothetical protein
VAVAPSVKLTRLIRTKDGGTLRTVGDARNYMLALPERRATQRGWQRAAELILDGGTSEAITRQVELALLLNGQIVLSR